MIELPSFTPGPPIAISASSFQKFLRCPDQGLSHFRGIYGQTSRDGWIGQLVHRLIARDLTEGPIEDIELVARIEIGSTNLNFDLAAIGRPSDIRRAIAEAVEVYVQFRHLPRPELSEIEVSIVHDAGGDVTLKGRMDGVQVTPDGVSIVDWKKGPIRPETRHQLTFYGLLWVLERQALPNDLQAISIQTGERASFPVSIADLERTVELVAGLVHDVRSALLVDRKLSREPGPWCRFCPILDGCGEGQETVSLLA
ncbi:MAG: DUF2800 domain-containing protein [Acidimicrobiia bacterium]|nr:DUF2800 domain-containing protein [Acidimicrobiia bacterium]